MLHIDIIAVVPELLNGAFDHSIIGRAKKKQLVNIQVHNLRDYSVNKHNKIDDYVFGGGAGMLIQIEPVDRLISLLKSQRTYDEVIYMSPDGELLDQNLANGLTLSKNLILLCGHYKGIDERIREHLITREISIGNYVLSGGELAAAVLSDAIIRLLPGVLSDETSALSDSFQDGLVDAPQYTRPKVYKGWEVPEILRSGNQAAIENWRFEQAQQRTKEKRPDFFRDEKK